jgi:outer membrane protein assembly factor BamB
VIEVNAATGAAVWTREAAANPLLSLYYKRKVSSSGALSASLQSLLVGEGQQLSAVKPTTGATQWSEAAGSQLGTPAAGDGVLYVERGSLTEGGEGALLALDATNGATLFSTGLGSAVPANATDPIVADGHVYVSDFGGTIRSYALP